MADNSEVVKLASIISDAKDEEIPTLLLRIKRLLQEYPQFSKEQQNIKQDILKYDLLSWCAVVLKHDFAKLEGGFGTASTITEILFECCASLSLHESEDFTESTLPEAVDNSLAIAWQIQQHFIEKYKLYGAIKYGAHAEERATLKLQFQAIIESVTKVLTSHVFLVDAMLKSDNLIRILIEEGGESERMVVALLDVVLRGIRMNPSAVRNLPTQSLNHLLDELIFKITSSESDALAAVTVKIIVAMIDACPEIANKMSVRFKGLKALMTRWMGHGFDRALQSLIEVLDAGNAKIAELARRTHAVKTIWAAYQGWKTRTRVARLHKVVPSLQSSFRRKRQENLELALKEKLGNEQKYASELARKRSMRSAREKQLQMLEIVPAQKVNKHIQSEERKAAVKIQSVWRGSMQRKEFVKEKYFQQSTSAAIIIQRAIRRFLEKRRKMRCSHPRMLTMYTKLTKERREELQMKIDQGRVVRGEKETTVAQAAKVHEETQKMLLAYHNKKTERSRFSDPKLQALVAKLHTEEELLENLSKLTEVTEREIESLSSGSNVIAVAAESEHRRIMKEHTSQWWQKLSLKTGGNLDPFEEKFHVGDRELQEIEDFIKESEKRDILFG